METADEPARPPLRWTERPLAAASYFVWAAFADPAAEKQLGYRPTGGARGRLRALARAAPVLGPPSTEVAFQCGLVGSSGCRFGAMQLG